MKVFHFLKLLKYFKPTSRHSVSVIFFTVPFYWGFKNTMRAALWWNREKNSILILKLALRAETHSVKCVQSLFDAVQFQKRGTFDKFQKL